MKLNEAITVEALDKQVEAGMLERFKNKKTDEFGYKQTELGISIMNKIRNGIDLSLGELDATERAGLNVDAVKHWLKKFDLKDKDFP